MSSVPVVCFDTCSLLDIMRDPSRDSMRVPDRIAGLTLLEAAEAGRLQCFLPEQVATEFKEHDVSTQEEAERAINRVRDQVGRINALDAVYGSARVVDLAHLDDHVGRARGIVGRWLARAATLQRKRSLGSIWQPLLQRAVRNPPRTALCMRRYWN